MAKLTSSDARDLSRSFREISKEIGDRRFDQWDQLSAQQRKGLEDQEWSLLNASSDMLGLAGRLSLQDLQATLTSVNDATAKMQKAVKNLNEIRKIIGVASAAIALAGAIISMNPAAIAGATNDAVNAIAATQSAGSS